MKTLTRLVHPVTARPAVWVEVRGVRHPGREHGWRDGGRIRTVEYVADGFKFYGDQPATRVTARHSDGPRPT